MRLYHATAASNVPLILKAGLIPGKSPGGDSYAAKHGMKLPKREPSVYLVKSKDAAKAFSMCPAKVNNSAGAVLAVNLPKDEAARLRVDEAWQDQAGALRYPGKIPAKYISVAENEIPVEEAKKLNDKKHIVADVDDPFTQVFMSLFG